MLASDHNPSGASEGLMPYNQECCNEKASNQLAGRHLAIRLLCAGVFGYSWVAILHVLIGLSFQHTLLLANLSVIAWIACYYLLLESPEAKQGALQTVSSSTGDLASSARTTQPGPSASSENRGEVENAVLLQGQKHCS